MAVWSISCTLSCFQSQSGRLPKNFAHKEWPLILLPVSCFLTYTHFIECLRHKTQIHIAKSLSYEIKSFLNCSFWMFYFVYFAHKTYTSMFCSNRSDFFTSTVIINAWWCSEKKVSWCMKYMFMSCWKLFLFLCLLLLWEMNMPIWSNDNN